MHALTAIRARNQLTLIWLVGLMLPALILAFRTYLGTYYKGYDKAAWEWFVPNCAPIVSLIAGWWTADGIGPRVEKRISRPIYLFTIIASLFYVGILNSIFVFEPILDSAPLDILKRTNLFMPVIQGIVMGAMVHFFTGSNNNDGPAKSTSNK